MSLMLRIRTYPKINPLILAHTLTSRPSHFSSLSSHTLTHSPSPTTSPSCYPWPKLFVTHSPTTLTICSVLFLLSAFLFKIFLLHIYIYIYIYCIQSEMFVSYESHLPSKGTRNHMTSAKYPNQVPDTLYVF